MFAPIARERVSDPRSDPSIPCRARDLAQLAPSQKKTAEAAERTTTAEKEERASSSFVPAAEEEEDSFVLPCHCCRHRGSARSLSRVARGAGPTLRRFMPHVLLLALFLTKSKNLST